MTTVGIFTPICSCCETQKLGDADFHAQRFIRLDNAEIGCVQTKGRFPHITGVSLSSMAFSYSSSASFFLMTTPGNR